MKRRFPGGTRALPVFLWMAVGCLVLPIVAWSDGPSAKEEQALARQISRTVIQTELERGRYADAEAIARDRLAQATENQDSLAIADAMDLLVDALRMQGKYRDSEAHTLAETSLAIRERLLDPDDPEIAFSLGALGRLLTSMSELDAAGPVLERALVIRRQHLRPTDPLLARSVADLGGWAQSRGDFAEAEAKHREATRLLEDGLGHDHPRVARSLLSLAIALQSQAQYDETAALLDRAASIYAANGWSEHPEFGILENIRGTRFIALGAYEEAKAALERSLLVFENALGPENPELTRPLTSLGTVARRLGQFAEARRYHERAVAIAETSLGPDHPLVAQCLNNVAGVLYELGSLEEATTYAERAHRIREHTLPAGHPDLAQSYRSLGILLEERGDGTRAVEMYRKALATYETSLGKDHPEVALVLFRLAWLLRDQGAVAEALSLSTRALAIGEQSLFRNNPDHASNLELHGSLLRQAGKCDSALAVYGRSRKIRVRSLGDDHPEVAHIDRERALLLAGMGRTREAMALAFDVEEKGRRSLILTARHLPERLALDYQKTRESTLDLLLTLAARRGAEDPAIVAEVWDALIRSRGLVLEEMAQRRHLDAHSTSRRDPERLRYSRTVERVATLQLQGPSESFETYRAALDSALAERNESEDALLRSNAAVREEMTLANLGFADVVAALPDSAALVAFVRFGSTDGAASSEGDGARPCGIAEREWKYLAFLQTGRDAEPQLFTLGSASEIDQLVRDWRHEVTRPPSTKTSVSTPGRDLSARIWDPIRARLGSTRRVFVVADGALHWVSFAALPGAPGEYTSDDGFLFQTLNSERELVPRTTTSPHVGGLLAFANPDYDAQSSTSGVSGKTGAASYTSASAASLQRGAGPLCPEFRELRWNRLRQTQREAEEAAKIWRSGDTRGGTASQRGRDEVIVLRDDRATETAFKADAPGREVLHLATHGFFLGGECAVSADATRGLGGLVGETSGAPADSLSNDALKLAGLVLAGANRRGERTDAPEDGILTSEEIAAMDLGGVNWAVLSACETGLGEPRSGEGVLGLRRSFLIAGVRTVVMSLWSVEDAATRTWMRELYRARFNEGHDSMQAAALANRRSLAARRAAGLSTHPFYWAAFQVSGDWR